ncbi:MAG: DUF1801 domain-containing protein [Proteobacteria bacterium]|nr:DUF1801 domain-containing protein [Pseudomonadota bacterium]
MTDPTFGAFADLLAITAEPTRPITTALRELVLDVDRDTVEVVRLGDRASTFGVGPKKMSEGYAYVLPYSKWVNLGFYKGAWLEDPAGLMQGTGAKMRHIKVRSVDEVGRPEVRALVVAALAERKAALAG